MTTKRKTHNTTKKRF